MPDEVIDALAPTPEAPARARELVRGLAADDATRRKVELIVSELVTNSVIHTASAPTERLRLRLRCEQAGVHGEVCDSGAGFDWKNAAPDLTEPGGLGLMIVDQLAANWGVQRNGETCVWFECVD